MLRKGHQNLVALKFKKENYKVIIKTESQKKKFEVAFDMKPRPSS